MKISAAAVAALGYVQCTSAFVGPQFAGKPLRSSKIHMHGDTGVDIPKWIGPISTTLAGLMFASQTVGATPVDLPSPPFLSAVETVTGKVPRRYSTVL
jgi:hypothetical protein